MFKMSSAPQIKLKSGQSCSKVEPIDLVKLAAKNKKTSNSSSPSQSPIEVKSVKPAPITPPPTKSRREAQSPSSEKSNPKAVSKSRNDTAPSTPSTPYSSGDGKSFIVPASTVGFEGFGGISHIIEKLRELVIYPVTQSSKYEELGVQPPRGILLYGPAGTGKSHLASALGCELHRASGGLVTVLKVTAPELVAGVSGDSEQRIRNLFNEACANAPSIIIVDEIDVITPRRSSAGKEMERRIVAQLVSCLDSISPETCRDRQNVLVLGTTNRASAIDSSVRRAGRIDREIAIGVPDYQARIEILDLKLKNLKTVNLDVKELSRITPGYVGADITALLNEAAANVVRRTLSNEHAELVITMEDFYEAVKRIQPSAKREGFATVPDTTWDDIGALWDVRDELEKAILQPIKYPEVFKRMKLATQCGVMLFGPPGNGKTLIAKAVANSSGCNFISVKGPELLNKYVGESERAVRSVFERARASSPCVVFFDELDSLAPKRSGGENQSSERLVNQLLTEMDGLEARGQVFMIGATNRPDIIDPALLRPGRFDKMCYVPLPSPEARADIVNTILKKLPVVQGDMERILSCAKSRQLDRYSGADLAHVCREASMISVQAVIASGQYDTEPQLNFDHFVQACMNTSPSVSIEDARVYEELHSSLRK